jgi:hypothetical protein
MQKHWFVVLLLGSLLYAPRATGQILAPSGFYIPIPIVGADQQIGNNPNYSNDLEAAEQRSSNNPASFTQDTNSFNPASDRQLLSFQVSQPDRQKNIARFIDRLRQTDTVSAENWAQVFATSDVFGQIDQAMSERGLDSTNLADAYAVYWTSAWLGSQGRTDEPPLTQLIAVRNQAAQALLTTPEVLATTDVQKQEIAEGLLIQAALIDSSIAQAQGNPALLRQVQTAIKQGAQTMGIDLDRLTLSDRGFILNSML